MARSHHSVTVIANKAYIFGGETAGGELCGTDVHAITLPDNASNTNGTNEYACYPAVPMKDLTTGDVLAPSPRSGHAACARGNTIIVHGGRGQEGTVLHDQICLWVWNSETLSWSQINPGTLQGSTPSPRYDHRIFYDEKQDILVLHGGRSDQLESAQAWVFDFKTASWTELPAAPAAPLSAAYVDETLYSLSSSSDLGGSIHFLDLSASKRDSNSLEWSHVDFPSNPLVPGPRPRVGAALVPVSTGLGRYYLLYLLGSREDADLTSDKTYTEEHPFYSDIWSLQLPSRGFTGANIKDAVRNTLPGVKSGSFSWKEIEVVPSEQTQMAGKVHPGPRGFFGADVTADGKGIILWGGINAKREAESDGWQVRVE